MMSMLFFFVMASKANDRTLLSPRASPSTGSTRTFMRKGTALTSTLLSKPRLDIFSSTSSSTEKSKATRRRVALMPEKLSSHTVWFRSSSITILKGVPGVRLSLSVTEPRKRSSLSTLAGVSTSMTARSGGGVTLPKPTVCMGMSRPAISFAVSKGDAPTLCKPSERITAAVLDCLASFFSSLSSSTLIAVCKPVARSVRRVSGD